MSSERHAQPRWRRQRDVSLSQSSPLLLALLGACGGGGSSGTNVIPAPPVIQGQPDAVTAKQGATAVTGNVLSNDVVAGSTLTVSAVAIQNGASGVVGQPLTSSLGILTLNADGNFAFEISPLDPVKSLPSGKTAVATHTYTPSAGGTPGTPQTLSITVTGANDAPVVGTRLSDASVNEGGTLNIQVQSSAFSDPDTGTALTLSARLGSGAALPSFLSFDPATGMLIAKPGASDSGIYSVRITALDDGNLTASQTFGLKVNNVVSGVVADGYINGATVFVDLNGNGVADPGEPLTTSDAAGRFSIVSEVSGLLRATGGVNTDTGLANTMILSAPAGSTVVNPITSIVQALIEQAVPLPNAEAAVKSALGIASSINLMSFDILAQSASDPAALAAQKAATSIASLIGQAQPAGANTELQTAILSKLAATAASGAPINLADAGTLQQILTATGKLGASSSLDIASKASAVNAVLSGATTFEAIAATQKSADANMLALAPSVINDTTSVNKGDFAVSGNLLANDRDANGDVIKVQAIGTKVLAFDPDPFAGAAPGYLGKLARVTGTYGSLYVQDDGVYTYALNNSDPDTIALARGQSGTETFSYTVRDATGLSSTGTLKIVVSAVNHVPVAISNTLVSSVFPTQPLSGQFFYSDSDGDTVTVVAVRTASGTPGTVGQVIQGKYGTFVINADRTYTYTPEPTAAAFKALLPGQVATEEFIYTISDGELTAEGKFSRTWLGANDQPTAVNDFGYGLTEDGPQSSVSGNVLGNDFDVDPGTTLKVTFVSSNFGNGSIVGTTVAGRYGSIVVQADGSFVYTINNDDPDTQALTAGQNGFDFFEYRVSDGSLTSQAVARIDIAGAADAPRIEAKPDTISVTSFSQFGSFGFSGTGILANDITTAGSLTITAVANSLGTAGTVGQPIVGTYGTLTLQSSGSYNYKVADNAAVRAIGYGQTVTDTFQYTPSSATLTGAPQTISVVVTGSAWTNVGDVLTGDLVSSPTRHLTGYNLNGTTVSVGQPLAGQYGTLSADSDGNFTYTPHTTSALIGLPEGQLVYETFSIYTANNIPDGTAAVSPFTVAVRGVNDAPVANHDTGFAVTEDASINVVSGNVRSNDTDPDFGAVLTVTSVEGSASNVGHALSGTYGSLVINADGSFAYTLDNSDPDTQALNTGDTRSEVFAYQISDGTLSSTATITIDVHGMNELP